MEQIYQIGFGGGCHWCTEAVFASLKGIDDVKQGWIASDGNYTAYSEAVCLSYNPSVISLTDLIAIHLHTHSADSQHSMRNKYRSAIYFFDEESKKAAEKALSKLQQGFKKPLITKVLPFKSFKSSPVKFQNYYYSDTEKPFCKSYIQPKLQYLQINYQTHINKDN